MSDSPRHGRRRAAFTLVELLVVIGIIALLMSILLPTLGRVRQRGVALKCLSNLRQICNANQMYLNENRQTLPFCNWGTDVRPNVRAGWLFEMPLSTNYGPDKVETGSFYPFVGNKQVYYCPAMDRESNSFGANQTNLFTSYLMNGAINSFGAVPSGAPGGTVTFHKFNRFKPSDAWIWEADERNGSAWNDGSSYPFESFDPSTPSAAGLAARHGKQAAIGFHDGHVELIEHAEYAKLASETVKNAVWNNPLTTNGR